MTEFFLKYADQATALKLIKELGFEAADITLFDAAGFWLPNKEMFCENYKEHAKELRVLADSLNLPIVQAHTCFHIHKEGDEEYNKNMLEIQKKSIEICGILGVKNVVIHPWNNWSAEENHEFYKQLLPLAKENNVVICTENMWNWTFEENHALHAACSSPEDFLKHMTTINDPNFGACVDVGHANMFAMVDDVTTPANMIKTLGKYVSCFHIHDNDGVNDSHQTPFTMTLDFESLARAIKEIGYEGDLVLEITNGDCQSLEEVCEKAKLQLEAGKKLVKLIEKQ